MSARGVGFGLAVTWLVMGGPVGAGDFEDRLSLFFEIGPALYRYEESGKREFAGLETEWADVALRVVQDARYRVVPDVTSLLRFSFLTSLEDTETNNVGAAPTDMRIAYLFNLQPGIQYETRPSDVLTVAPEISWDLDWYLQTRDTGSGTVDESAFRHGPSPGLEVAFLPPGPWGAVFAYRHSFLIDVEVSNTFAEGLGFGDFSSDGHRDVAEVRAVRMLAGRWSAAFGYRFESARIAASRTESRRIETPDGPQTIRIQFPENDHWIHSFGVSVEARF